MKIVIEIPDKQYELIKQSDYNAFSMFASKECMMYAIKNGIPLPKVHGRLIDADATIEIQSGTHLEVIVGKAKIEKRSIEELIKASNSEVPTIIPKEESEGE